MLCWTVRVETWDRKEENKMLGGSKSSTKLAETFTGLLYFKFTRWICLLSACALFSLCPCGSLVLFHFLCEEITTRCKKVSFWCSQTAGKLPQYAWIASQVSLRLLRPEILARTARKSPESCEINEIIFWIVYVRDFCTKFNRVREYFTAITANTSAPSACDALQLSDDRQFGWTTKSIYLHRSNLNIYVSVLFLAWYEFRFSQTPSSASTMPRSAESARFSSDPTRRSWSNSLQLWWSTATSENSKSSMTTALERSSWTLLEDSTRPVSSLPDSTFQSLTSRSGPTHSFHLVSSGE